MDPNKSFKQRKFAIALIVITAFLSYGTSLFFIEYPESNKDAIIGVGAVLSTVVVLAIKEYLDGTPDNNNNQRREYPPRQNTTTCRYPGPTKQGEG